jgi:dihydrofolate reductase
MTTEPEDRRSTGRRSRWRAVRPSASSTPTRPTPSRWPDGLDVRIGGGPTTVREFLAAGLVDHLHVVVVPILLGRGVRLWDGLEGLEAGHQVEAASSPGGVTHLTFTRTAR